MPRAWPEAEGPGPGPSKKTVPGAGELGMNRRALPGEKGLGARPFKEDSAGGGGAWDESPGSASSQAPPPPALSSLRGLDQAPLPQAKPEAFTPSPPTPRAWPEAEGPGPGPSKKTVQWAGELGMNRRALPGEKGLGARPFKEDSAGGGGAWDESPGSASSQAPPPTELSSLRGLDQAPLPQAKPEAFTPSPPTPRALPEAEGPGAGPSKKTVPGAGLEPACGFPRAILSRLRMPIPPPRRSRAF